MSAGRGKSKTKNLAELGGEVKGLREAIKRLEQRIAKVEVAVPGTGTPEPAQPEAGVLTPQLPETE